MSNGANSAPSLRPFNVNAAKPIDTTDVLCPTKKGMPVVVAKRCRTTENLMMKIEAFFSNAQNMGKLLPFLRNKTKISRRFIEWFISVYAMENNVVWVLNDSEYFDVYLDYQAQMDEYTKQRFDPFGRKWRKKKRKDGTYVQVYHGIHFYYSDDEYIVTTVAQLNFFKWFIEKSVLDYLIDNYEELLKQKELYQSKKKTTKKRRASSKGKSSKKQQQRSGSKRQTDRKVRVRAMKRVTKRNVEVLVSFD